MQAVLVNMQACMVALRCTSMAGLVGDQEKQSALAEEAVTWLYLRTELFDLSAKLHCQFGRVASPGCCLQDMCTWCGALTYANMLQRVNVHIHVQSAQLQPVHTGRICHSSRI